MYFNNPNKVPVFSDVRGDVCPLITQHSKDWKPGWKKGEKDLFPHIRGKHDWDRPPWATENPKYEGNKWKQIPHKEVDEWGCIWDLRGKDTNMGHPGRAAIHNWDEYDEFIKKYNPDPMDKSRYEFALQLKDSFGKERYRIAHIADFGPFSRVSMIRGFSKFLIDHRKNPEIVQRALKRETDWHVQAMKACFKYDLDPHGFWIVDDLGEQTGPFFSPEIFKKFYKSVYKTLCDEAHQLGAEIHLHCCGKVDQLLPLLIKWGLDAIEFDSPRMSGYPDLRKFRGKIMFWGCVNIQSIYPNGTLDEIEREVWHMIRNLGTKNGGYGAFFYPTPTDLHVPNKNIKAFHKGIEKYGNYSEIPETWWEYPVSKNWDNYNVPPLPKS
jgi:hypothetical protein